jgi:hypothetical protein
MRLLIILIAALWGVASVLAFARTRDKSLDAKMTAFFIVFYPALVVVLLLNEPVPMLLAIPTAFGLIPWLLAGPHLGKILKEPARRNDSEVMGIPKAYWLWGGLGSLLLGLLFN